MNPVPVSCRDEWADAIQMVAESLAKQEEEGILCSPTSQIENVNEEEMDTSISHYKRKVSPRKAAALVRGRPRFSLHVVSPPLFLSRQ